MRSSKEILDFLCRRWEKRHHMWRKTVLKEERTDGWLSYRHITGIAVNEYPSMAFERMLFHAQKKKKKRIYGSVQVKFFDDDGWYPFYVRPSTVDGSCDYKIVDINSDGDVYDVVLRRFLEIAKTDDIILHAQSFIDAGESLEEILVKIDLEDV